MRTNARVWSLFTFLMIIIVVSTTLTTSVNAASYNRTTAVTYAYVVIVLSRILVGSILAFAGLAKLSRGQAWFESVVRGYDLLPKRIAMHVSKLLPLIELGSGLCLALGFFTRVAAATGFLLLCTFSWVLAVSVLREKRVDCGCFGRSRQANLVRWRLIYRNLGLSSLLLPVCAYGGGKLSFDDWFNLASGETVFRLPSWLSVTWIVCALLLVAIPLVTRIMTKRQLAKRRQAYQTNISGTQEMSDFG